VIVKFGQGVSSGLLGASLYNERAKRNLSYTGRKIRREEEKERKKTKIKEGGDKREKGVDFESKEQKCSTTLKLIIRFSSFLGN
jgi:hypothetical protein